jgi:hypothetical protein
LLFITWEDAYQVRPFLDSHFIFVGHALKIIFPHHSFAYGYVESCLRTWQGHASIGCSPRERQGTSSTNS